MIELFVMQRRKLPCSLIAEETKQISALRGMWCPLLRHSSLRGVDGGAFVLLLPWTWSGSFNDCSSSWFRREAPTSEKDCFPTGAGPPAVIAATPSSLSPSLRRDDSSSSAGWGLEWQGGRNDLHWGHVPIDNFHFSFRQRRIHMAPIYRACNVIQISTDGTYTDISRWSSPIERFLVDPFSGFASMLFRCRGLRAFSNPSRGFPFPVILDAVFSKWLLGRYGN